MIILTMIPKTPQKTRNSTTNITVISKIIQNNTIALDYFQASQESHTIASISCTHQKKKKKKDEMISHFFKRLLG